VRLRVFTMRNVLVFLAVCVLASTLSGGVILGVGPFEAKLVTEGYFAYLCEEGVVGCTAQYDAIAPIFDGGFQMMTWFTCVGGMLLQRTGPRFVALTGLSLSVIGFYVLSIAKDKHGVVPLMLGYGLIGGGGNTMYISCFHFASLFENLGLPCSILAGLFNLAGLNFMILDVSAISLSTFCVGYAIYAAVAMIGVFFVFPDVRYGPGDIATLQLCPTWCCKGEPAEEKTSFIEDDDTQNTWEDTKAALCDRRYWWFVFAFAWAAMANQVQGGFEDTLAVSKHASSRALNAFENYAFPIIGNTTFLFTPLMGILLDKCGFTVAFILQAVVSQAATASCFLPTLSDLYGNLVFYNLTQSIVYSLIFAYLMMTYPAEIYGNLVSCTIAIQGLVGFIAWPILSPNPFGSKAFAPELLILLVPGCIILYGNAYVQWADQSKWDKVVVEITLSAATGTGSAPNSRRGSWASGSFIGKLGMDYGSVSARSTFVSAHSSFLDCVDDESDSSAPATPTAIDANSDFVKSLQVVLGQTPPVATPGLIHEDGLIGWDAAELSATDLDLGAPDFALQE